MPHLSRDCLDKNEQEKPAQMQAPKKYTPKEVYGNIRGMMKEERTELLALMTVEDEDF